MRTILKKTLAVVVLLATAPMWVVVGSMEVMGNFYKAVWKVIRGK